MSAPSRNHPSPILRPKQTVRTVKQRLPPEPAQIRDDESAARPGSWTLNSLQSEFTGIHAGLGRAFRSFGRLIVDPLDNFIGRRELRRLRKQLDQLSAEEWAIFPELFHVDMCVKRMIECIRYVSESVINHDASLSPVIL
jgi:hypothetical protein